ncbi:MAG: hypothetical protein RR415_03495 [Ruthenibacterium sp.]
MKRHCRAWDGERRGDESYVGMAGSDEGVAPYRTACGLRIKMELRTFDVSPCGARGSERFDCIVYGIAL